MSEKLSLDSKLLKPIKDNLEQSINIFAKHAITTRKESEITLKINISVDERNDNGKSWLEPKFEYSFNEKIKEAKSKFKDDVGYNYQIELDDDNNILVEKVNEQENLFEEEN